MADKDLDALFYDTMRDMYYAERHILSTLPKLQEAAASDELKAAFEHHQTETEGQIQRLEQVFGLIDRKPTNKRCASIDGILAEGDEHHVDLHLEGGASYRRQRDRDAPRASLRARGSPAAPGSPPRAAASPPIGGENADRSHCSPRRPPLLGRGDWGEEFGGE